MAISGVPLDKNQILQSISLKKGIVKHAAEHMGCDPRALYDWMNRDEDVNNAVIQAREAYAKERVDEDVAIVKSAYKSINALLDEGDVTATIFALKTKAGWREKDDSQTNVTVIMKHPYTDGE